MGFFNALADCFICNRNKYETLADEKATVSFTEKGPRTTQEIAADVINILLTAEKNDRDLERSLQDTVNECGWTENLGKAILSAVETAIREGAVMGQVMRDASEKAILEAYEFAKDHPAYCTLIALGILASLALPFAIPWVLEAIGFGLEGPIEGKGNPNLMS